MSKRFQTRQAQDLRTQVVSPKKKKGTPKKALDTTTATPVTSLIDKSLTEVIQDLHTLEQGQEQRHMVTLTKDSKERKGNGKSAVYHIDGVRGSVKISSTVFAGGQAPATLEVDIPNLAQAGVPKAKETAEERKARLAALPKLTPVEKLAKLEAKVARAKAKLAGVDAPASM